MTWLSSPSEAGADGVSLPGDCALGCCPGLAHSVPNFVALRTVSSHRFNSQDFKLGVSNPRTIAYHDLNMPFESSDLPGAGPICPDRTFEDWPYTPACAPARARARGMPVSLVTGAPSRPGGQTAGRAAMVRAGSKLLPSPPPLPGMPRPRLPSHGDSHPNPFAHSFAMPSEHGRRRPKALALKERAGPTPIDEPERRGFLVMPALGRGRVAIRASGTRSEPGSPSPALGLQCGHRWSPLAEVRRAGRDVPGGGR